MWICSDIYHINVFSFRKASIKYPQLSSRFLPRQVLGVYSGGFFLRNIQESDSKALRNWEIVSSVPNERSMGLRTQPRQGEWECPLESDLKLALKSPSSW